MQTMYHTEFVDIFMPFIQTKFHMPSSSSSLAIIAKLKANTTHHFEIC